MVSPNDKTAENAPQTPQVDDDWRVNHERLIKALEAKVERARAQLEVWEAALRTARMLPPEKEGPHAENT